MTVADDTWDEPDHELEQQAAQQPDAPVTRLADRRPGHRLPPHDDDAERALIGAALHHPATADLLATIPPGDWYRPAHSHIAAAITALVETGVNADPLTVADHLRGHGLLDNAGGLPELVRLMAEAPGVTNTGHYAAIIRNHATRRALIAAGTAIGDQAWTDPDAATAAGAAQAAIDAVQDRLDRSATTLAVADLIADQLAILEARHDGTNTGGVPTGLTDLDHLLGGLHPGQLIVCGARPGVGKTDLALWIGLHAASAGLPVLHASLEMGATELLDRLYATVSHVPYATIRSGRLSPRDWESISEATAQLATIPLTIRDDAGDTVAAIRAAARRIDGLALITVDYLQLLTPARHTGDRRVDVDEISRSLKRLARSLNVPVLVLAQLNRAVDTRSDKHPILSDFRESGGIEADADVALGLYRDELVNPGSPDAGVMEIHVLKQRAGALGKANVGYQPGRKTFADLAGLNDRNPT